MPEGVPELVGTGSWEPTVKLTGILPHFTLVYVSEILPVHGTSVTEMVCDGEPRTSPLKSMMSRRSLKITPRKLAHAADQASPLEQGLSDEPGHRGVPKSKGDREAGRQPPEQTPFGFRKTHQSLIHRPVFCLHALLCTQDSSSSTRQGWGLVLSP